MFRRTHRLVFAVIATAALTFMAACSSEADIAARNVSTGADQFEVTRSIHFYDSIQGRDLLLIEGRCSLGNDRVLRAEISVTCKTGPNTYLKHFLGLADNVTYFIEQTEPVVADPYRYRVLFNPVSLIPNIDLIGPGVPVAN